MVSPCSSRQADLEDAFKKFVAGGTAAILSKTTTAPIDRIKLVLQLQNGQTYVGARDCLSKLYVEQGILSLWRGNGAGVARCFPSHALNFLFRDVYRKTFLDGIDRKKAPGHFFIGNVCAGGVGGATTLVILYPLDFARTRIAVDQRADGSKAHKGLVSCLQEIRRKDGVVAWYRGFSPAVQFVVASRAVFFGLFDTTRLSISDTKQLSFLSTFALAQLSLVISGLTCYPMDTVRRKMMMDVGRAKRVFKSSADCWAKIARREGMNGFYKGALTNSLRSTGGALIITLYYEFTKHF